MDEKTYKVEPATDGGWRVVNDSTNRISGVLPTKDQALTRAEALANAAEPSILQIFGDDGVMTEERYYRTRIPRAAGDSPIA